MSDTERYDATGDEGAGAGAGSETGDPRSPGFSATDAGGEFGTAQGGDLGEVTVGEQEPVPDDLSYDDAKRALGG
ncbi:MAG: hypothetical protein M3Q48_16730 [Actinomycetota bacterium]|nr:hypothetical protein [Actinomycetota bacterium]